MSQNASKDCPYTAFLCGRGTFIISVAVLALVVLNCLLIMSNRGLQNDIIAKQQSLQEKNTKYTQTQTLANIYQNIIQALANASLNKKDAQIKNLLDQNGLKVEPASAANAPAAAAPAAAPAPVAPAKP